MVDRSAGHFSRAHFARTRAADATFAVDGRTPDVAPLPARVAERSWTTAQRSARAAGALPSTARSNRCHAISRHCIKSLNGRFLKRCVRVAHRERRVVRSAAGPAGKGARVAGLLVTVADAVAARGSRETAPAPEPRPSHSSMNTPRMRHAARSTSRLVRAPFTLSKPLCDSQRSNWHGRCVQRLPSGRRSGGAPERVTSSRRAAPDHRAARRGKEGWYGTPHS
jgi:hypothetical protein